MIHFVYKWVVKCLRLNYSLTFNICAIIDGLHWPFTWIFCRPMRTLSFSLSAKHFVRSHQSKPTHTHTHSFVSEWINKTFIVSCSTQCRDLSTYFLIFNINLRIIPMAARGRDMRKKPWILPIYLDFGLFTCCQFYSIRRLFRSFVCCFFFYLSFVLYHSYHFQFE